MEGKKVITALDNPLVRRIKVLQSSSKARRREGAFWVDEYPITLIAMKEQSPIEAVVYSTDLLNSRDSRIELDQYRQTGIRWIPVSESVFRYLSARNDPDGFGAICNNMWSDGLDGLHRDSSDILVAIEGISDPGNLGTIMRVLDSIPRTTLILAGQSCNPSHPRVVRASRGTVFSVPMYRCSDIDAVFSWSTEHQIQTVATSARAGTSFWEANYRIPVVCIFGNEHRGLGSATKKAANQLVSIPMGGVASSLNVAISVSLVLYEIKRRRS